MSERETYPSGVPCWVEALQPDPEAGRRFYGGLFGWEFEGPGEMAGEPDGGYFVARVRDRDVAGVGSLPDGAPAPAWTTHIRVESADTAAEAVEGAGGAVVVEPFDVPPAGRLAVVDDPTGARFCVWEAGAREGAQLVNEPGAWAMSALRTRDFEGAAGFYNRVFGWELDRFDLGGDEIGMFRLPGFVGGEPQQPVPRDVVAAMMGIRDDQPSDQAPGWRPDFWVADVDAAAARVAELGGVVLEAPADVPGTGLRQGVVADPDGAAFSITQPPALGD